MDDQKKPQILTGHARLDFEHFQILNALEKLTESYLTQSSRIALCEKLLHYISDHCKDEEHLMVLYDYPESESHIEQHSILQQKFLENIGLFIKENGINAETVRNLFYNHITYTDMPFIEYMKQEDTKEE